jgi:outer membrane protein assembly factor BamB
MSMLKGVCGSPLGRRSHAAAASGVAVLLSVLAPCFVSAASAATTGWPMFQQSAQHTGQAAAAGPGSPTVAWTFAGSGGFQPQGSPPIVGPDGTVYVANIRNGSSLTCTTSSTKESVVDAISPQGHLLWQWTEPCGSIFRSGMAVAPNGTVFAIVDNEALVAIAAGGTTLWRMPIDSEGEVTIGPDGTLYVQDLFATTVFAINPTNGQALWTYSPPSGHFGARGTPALSPDGSTIYANSSGGVLTALTTSGAVKWTLSFPGSEGLLNAPAVGPDGTIYVTSSPGVIAAVTPQGALKWSYNAGNTFFETAPAVGKDGLVMAADDAGTLIALSAASGSVAWTAQAPGEPGSRGFYNSSPLIDANGNTYIQNQFEVFAFRKDGSALWTMPQPAYQSSLALDPVTKQLYFVAESGLFALSSTPIETAEYKNWRFSGSLTDKKLGQPFVLPEGSTFNGSGELNTETGAGSVKGNLSVPPFTTAFKLLGVLPVRLGTTLTQVGAFEGTVAKSETVAGDETLTIPAKLNLGITSIGIFGLNIPTNCVTAEPIALSLTDTLTREELLTKGWSFNGTTTLPSIACEGGLFGSFLGVVLSHLLSGPENPYALTIRSPTG